MKCLDNEKLISYACGLAGKAGEAEVRAHLEECLRCRALVGQYGRLDAVLDEWKAAEPTPWFDARLRQAVEAQETVRETRSFLGREWVRALAVASLGLLIIAGVVWFTRTHASLSNSSRVTAGVVAREPHPARAVPAPANVAKLHRPAVTAHAATPASAVPELDFAGVSSNDDKDTQALEDYDLAANFDVLSELPKEQPGVAN